MVFSLPWFTKYLEISPKKSGILLIITGWGESGKVILQVSIAVFSGTVKKIFRQRWLSPPRKNWPDILNPRRQVSILEREPDIAVYKHGACLNTRISYDMRVTYDVCWDKLTKDKLKIVFLYSWRWLRQRETFYIENQQQLQLHRLRQLMILVYNNWRTIVELVELYSELSMNYVCLSVCSNHLTVDVKCTVAF